MPKYTLNPPTYDREKFLVHSVDDAFKSLRRYGVAVMPNVWPKEKIQPTVDGILDVLRKTFPGFDPDDKSTYQHLRNHGLVHGMLAQTHGLGWSQPVVDLRQDPAIVDLWVQLWKLRMAETGRDAASSSLEAKDMLSSTDGIAAYFNHTSLRGGFHKDDWLHWDRAPSDSKAWSIQSFVNLLPSGEGGAAFQCLPKSHRDQEEFAIRFPETASKRFHLLENQQQVDFFVKENKREHCCIRAEPGDAVFWDSRLIHAARPPTRGKTSLAEDKFYRRLVVYVSMQPARFAGPLDLKRKRSAYEQLRSTTHNAAHGVELFNKYQRIRCPRDEELKKSSMPISTPPVLSELGRSLFGVEKK